MKERRKTLPPRLKQISDDISEALKEAKKIRELTIQEEVMVELDKVNGALGRGKETDLMTSREEKRLFPTLGN